MEIGKFYWQLLKGSPRHVREGWETAVFWIALVFGALLGFNPELAKRVQDSWDGFSRWSALAPLVVFVGWRLAKNNHRAFEQLQSRLVVHYGPNLVPIRCEPQVWSLIEYGASAPHAACKAWVVVFQNDPINPEASAHAKDVLAEISYHVNEREIVKVMGRWGETEQPVAQLNVIPRKPIIDLETVDIKIGQSRVLAIAVRMSNDAWFAFSNESYRDGFDNKKFSLKSATDVTVIVRLRGVGVDGRYIFSLRGTSGDLRLALVDSQPRPQSTVSMENVFD
jgi:hypothetical protein